MTSKIKDAIFIGVIILLLGSLSYTGISYFGLSKKYVKMSEEKEIILAQWNKLIRTPPRVTIKTIMVSVGPGTVTYPKPLPHAPEIVPVPKDTNQKPPSQDISYQWYSPTDSIGDSIFVKWSAQVYGRIEWFKLDEVRYPQTEKIIERIVPMPPENFPQKELKPKSHIGMYAGGVVNNFKEFPGLQSGLILTFRDKWGLQGGALYLPNMESGKQWYGGLNVILYFK
jgi:hypothetical protein